MVRPAAKRSGLGSKQEAAGSNVFGGSDKDITDKEITFSDTELRLACLPLAPFGSARRLAPLGPGLVAPLGAYVLNCLCAEVSLEKKRSRRSGRFHRAPL